MSASPPAGSYLIADCGHATTTVALFDRVAGRQRLIATASAPTAAGSPAIDIAEGIRQAVRRLEAITGPFSSAGDVVTPAQPSGTGVDYFGLTISAAPPLRAVIAGLVEDASVASARRALATIYATEVDRLTLSDTRDEEAQVNTLLSEQPDIVILTGGTDDGEGRLLLRILDTIDLALSLREGGGARASSTRAIGAARAGDHSPGQPGDDPRSFQRATHPGHRATGRA